MNTKKDLLLSLLILLLCISCDAQNFTYQKIENPYGKFISPTGIDFVDLTDYLPKNHVKDASVDYTVYIQKAIDEHKNLRFPNFPILINEEGLKLKSNSNIYFDKHSSLVLKPTASPKYRMMLLKDIQNVNIYNPKLMGDRKKHLRKDGEHGMGIRIQNSKSINIYNFEVRDTWGDGIYITSLDSAINNQILLKNGWVDNVRRNGISIISGRNVTVDSVQISNVNGTPPSSGIDIEPNRNTNFISNIELKNILTINNERDGIVISLKRLIPFNSKNQVSLNLSNHEDVGSRYALRFSAMGSKKDVGKNLSMENLPGKIMIDNVDWSNSRMPSPFLLGEHAKLLPKVELKNIHTQFKNKAKKRKQIKGIIKENVQIQYLEKH